jgi:ADP-heptose:LPS heptosyltransferase
MKITTMRWVDAWVGVPLCLIASGLRAVARCLFGTREPADKPRSLLIIKLSELGALITLGPAMHSLTALVGRDNLYFLTFAESRALLEVLDYIPKQNIFILRTDSLLQMIRSALDVMRRVRGLRIDSSIDLDFFSRATALLSWLSGCRRRAGCHAYFGEGPYRGNLLTHRVKFNPHMHVSRMFETLAKAAEHPAADFPRLDFIPEAAEPPRQRFRPSAEETARIRKMLVEAGAGPHSAVVLLNSNISDREAIPLRKWADEHYVDLARRILAGIPESIVLLTGLPNEAEIVARLAQSVGQPRCRSVAGKTTFRELLTLYDMSTMIVTNDSGPAHFATLTEIDVVVLFGPETPLMWRPLGPRVQVMYRGMACSPCFTVYNGRQSQCRRNQCMDFTPAEVYEVVRQRLAARITEPNGWPYPCPDGIPAR